MAYNYRKRRRKKKGFVSIGDWDRMQKEKEEKKRVILIDDEDWMAGCWLSPYKYMRFNGRAVHQIYAAGEGCLARHLCCNYHCVNPMHLVRGSDWDNRHDQDLINKVFLYAMDNRIDLIHKYRDIMELFAAFIKTCTKNNMAEQPVSRIVRDQLINADTLMSAFKRSDNIIVEVNYE